MCPTNYYSLTKYDPTKETAIIMQKYEYFEPIYIVIDQSKKNKMSIVTTKLYIPNLMTKIPNMKKLANTIQEIYSTMCKPLSSLPKAYKYKEIKFKRNITLERSVEILTKYEFTIQSLVVNYDDKVIGLNIEKREQSGFIPCFPSGIISSYELVDIENEGQQKNFEETIQFLKMVTDETKGEILCKPIVKILEDKLIVGLLTETNQFIPLIEPEQDTDQSIKYSVDDENFIQVDKITQTSKKIDKTREEFVKKIKLETELYNAFRNKLRTMLNNFINKNVRDEIEMVANSVQMVYFLQLERLIMLIKKLLYNDVNFIPVSSENIKHIENNLKSGDVLLVPKTNLLSNLDNETIYFSKIADELIRYNRIKQFMFKPKMFLSFTDLKYDLNMDEIILLQSLMTNEYFDDLVPAVTSKYISFNTYDTTEPSITQKYDNEYMIPVEKDTPTPTVAKEAPTPTVAKEGPRVEKVDDYIKRMPVEKRPFKIYNNCPVAIKEIFSKLKMKFRGGYKDLNFSFNTPNCTFDVALTMINNIISTPIDIIGVKQQLIQKYQELFSSYPREIVNMFDYYGYMTESKELATGRLSIENMIMSENYYITNFDLMMISSMYDIPLTLIAPRVYRENNNEYLSMNVKTGYTFIIRTSGVNKYKPGLPKFKMIINKSGDGMLDIINLPEQKIRDEINSQTNNIVDLLKTYNTMISDEPIGDENEAEDLPVRQDKQEEEALAIAIAIPLKEDKQPTKLKIKTKKLKLVDNE
jgi:hypothetical protein